MDDSARGQKRVTHSARTYQRGDLVLVDLEPVVGSEQGLKRPCVVLSNFDTVKAAGITRPLYFVVPLTTAHKLSGPLAPLLKQSQNGLRADSIALVMQAKAIDGQRVISHWGSVSTQDITTLQSAIKVLIEG